MLQLHRLVLVLVFLALPAASQAEADGTAFRQVIQSQLEAFQRDDGDAAFAYASPTIRSLFGTPETFMRMVVTGYPQVYRPQSVTFGAVTVMRGQPTQIVYLTGPDGDAVIAYYLMQRQPDGTWQINGVLLEPAANV